MSGSQYIALSGLRARVDELDRLATDIANVGTTGYKGEREARAAAERDAFDATLQTAIDTTFGGRRLDVAKGSFATTGRPLDVALDGPGFFVVSTPAGPRYTRNGHFTVNAENKLVAEDGAEVQGESGGITVEDKDGGEIRVDSEGTVWSGTTKSGQLQIVEFTDPSQLTREQGSRLHAGGLATTAATKTVVRSGTLEQSNVSVADRLAELTTVSRGFEALQKAISLLMNDVDGRAIEHLGRR
jgi:flagellar basal-body rod protein FlgF